MQQSDKVALIQARLKAIDDLVIRACLPAEGWDRIVWNNITYNPSELSGDLASKAKALHEIQNRDYGTALIITSIMFGFNAVLGTFAGCIGEQVIAIAAGSLSIAFGIGLGISIYKWHSTTPELNQKSNAFWKARKDHIVKSCDLTEPQDDNKPFELKINASEAMSLARNIKIQYPGYSYNFL